MHGADPRRRQAGEPVSVAEQGTVTQQQTDFDATAMRRLGDADLIAALRATHYPDAPDHVIYLVVNYCKVMGLNPMQKPVHPVKHRVNVAERGQPERWEDRWTLLGSIGLYRTQASRTGEHAQTSVPEFGPTIDGEWIDDGGPVRVSYPEWCRVTVKRVLPSGHIAEYEAVERWLENYATVSRTKETPNSMWRRRPFAQLAKCAEAQALRKGFPELLSGTNTDDEYGPHWETGSEALMINHQVDAQAAELAEQMRNMAFRNNAEAATVVPGGEDGIAHARDLRLWQERLEQPFSSPTDANRLLAELKDSTLTSAEQSIIRAQIHQRARDMARTNHHEEPEA